MTTRSPVLPPAARAQGMPRSAIREIMALAAGRPEVIHLEVGEPDSPVAPAIIEATAEAMRAGATGYTPNAGLPALRELVAARYAARWRHAPEADRVVVTTGAIGALHAALLAVVDRGDEVLIPDPGWPNYHSICHLAEARAVRYRLDPARGFLPDMDELRRLTGPRTRAIVINTPGNPTGAVFPQAVMAELAEHVARTGVYLISDEIYEDMVFAGRHVSAGDFDIHDRLIVISGVSKSYAMTGFRIGFAICPPALAPLMASLQEPVTSCAATPSQKAAEAALGGDQSGVAALCDVFRRRAALFVAAMGEGLVPVRPAGAFYTLVDISSTGMDSLSFCKLLLREDAVAAVPGITFGPASDSMVRVAFSASDTALETAAVRMRSRIETLAGAGAGAGRPAVTGNRA